ncbi:MAG: hypothetical protein IKE38_01775, partial [Erysipelotrichaceae bacterium]|nr:hypothetical protein [Erysipelotrichaceae bacterium]
SECIHCGCPLRANEEELVSIVDNLTPVSEEEIEAYDVMLVDYDDSKFATATSLKKLLDITYKEAYSILATLPCYIYNDIPQSDAEYIARKLMNMNMRVAVYDPVGNVRYYEPPKYLNRPLPIVAPMPRVRRIVRPNIIVHHQPMPSPSPIIYYNTEPKGPAMKPKKNSGPSFMMFGGNDAPKKTTTVKTKPQSVPKKATTTYRTGGSSGGRPASSKSQPAVRSGGSRSSSSRTDASRRGKR